MVPQTHPEHYPPESSNWPWPRQGLSHLHVSCPNRTVKHCPTALNKGPGVTKEEPHGFQTPQTLSSWAGTMGAPESLGLKQCILVTQESPSWVVGWVGGLWEEPRSELEPLFSGCLWAVSLCGC